MPALPTLNVSDAQAQRITKAFGSVSAYKEWLKGQIIDFVINNEEQALMAQYVADRQARKENGTAQMSSEISTS